MKKEINAPVAIIIAAVGIVAVCVGLYFKFLYEPKLDPKVLGDSQAGVSRTQERLRQAGIGGPGGGGPPNSHAASPSGSSQ